jgi:hypothetical protein
MGRIKNSVEAMISGKVGNMVFVQDHGQQYIRTIPVRTKNSWSPKQKMHRKRFAMVNKFCNHFKKTMISEIWNLSSPSNRGYSLFVKANMPAFALDGSLIDPRMLQVSTGNLLLPRQIVAQRQGEGTSSIVLSWQNDPNLSNERLNDNLMAVVSNGQQYSGAIETGLSRSALEGTFELPLKPSDVTLVYLFFAARDGKDYSSSISLEV